MKRLLRSIKKRLDNKSDYHYFIDNHEAMMIQSDWLKLFGTGGCDCYPYTSEMDMFNDLCEHYHV